MTGIALVVDPFEAGALYAPLLAERGFEVHAAFSDPPLAGVERRATLRREDFAACHEIAQGGLPTFAPGALRAVLAGHEHGVLAADAIAAAFGIPGNDPALSAARRDKALQAEVARDAGLLVPDACWSADREILLDWARRCAIWPVVAKPARGYGSHQVRRCQEIHELEAALDAIFGERNTLGGKNLVAGVQEMLRGRELAIDSVSGQGRHQIVAIWEYLRPSDDGRGPVPLFAEKRLLPLHGDEARRATTFVLRLLDALGIAMGPAHTEVMLVAGEPVLIELGARLHGGQAAHRLARRAFGEAQVDRVVEGLATGRLAARPPGGRPATMLILPRGLALLFADPPPLTVELLIERRQVDALVPAWDALLDRSDASRTFASSRFFRSWLDTVPEWQPRLLLARQGGAPVGLLALVEEEDGVWRFPGALADYQDAVVGRGDVGVAAALAAELRRRTPAFVLENLRPDAALAPFFPEAAPSVACPFAELRCGEEAYFRSRKTGFRTGLRRARRRAADAGAEVLELEPATFDPAALPALFLDLHGARFARSCFDRPHDRAFVHEALPALFADRRLRVFALRRGAEILALMVCTLGPDALGVWNGGWRPEAASLAPGKLLLDHALRQACREGLHELDLMRGQEPYKADWATTSRRICSVGR